MLVMTAGKLRSRVALVTGASRGIGRAIALGFAREGARMALTARSERELDSLVQEIESFGGTATAIPADLLVPDMPRRIVAEAAGVLGPVDILVNNAGVGSAPSPRPVISFDDEFWNLTLALNLTIPYLFCKAVLPLMKDKRSGRIINIASLASRVGLLHGAAYAASKHGLLGLTRCVAIECAADGITANAICPGPVRTQMNDRRMAYDAQRLGVPVEELAAKATPIGRRLEAEEIVSMAVLLASDESAAITGQAFNICGGMVMP
jgi:NAD(P)-dependent dehydrogenase (short-subunit alcohol dehydrogenase family)